ncbi:hypothetical protein [Luteibacter aegosomatissinici]|uniref:hypothetical protein n=1 Tax=Luteibacter aegosomatissinici TaxID=2911539 RepID=UPI001FFA8E89|nr:hypothetical protein [Luteibacter aegosomatissinici]UPG92633.1 hypothetical protein L2Y97_12215 [Luteibacter aegosomatissinici]
MVTLSVRCTDQRASDCFKTVEVETGVSELTPAQLAEIFERGPSRPPTSVPAAAAIVPDTTYFVPVSLDDAVCASCLRDRSSEIPE